jgi:periplasmic copper chaperone A
MTCPFAKALALAAIAGASSSAASAHVVFSDTEAQAGGYYTGFLRVGHGCGESPTVALRVTLPESVITARPQPKPGWTLKIEKASLAKPVPAEGGGSITQRVSAITWIGLLPVDQFDQFGLSMKLPDTPGPLYFPVVQTCEKGKNAWTAVPSDGTPTRRPAPRLMLAPARTEHAHH